MRKALSILCFFGISACSGAGGMMAPSSDGALPATAAKSAETVVAAAAAPVVWNVGTGASTYSYAVQDLDFLPAAITINAGDSITYHVGSGAGGDAHTIAYFPASIPLPSQGDPDNLAPYGGTTVDGVHKLNSGILVGGQTFTLHFPLAGTYTIVCLFHRPAMMMTVTVQKAGSVYPHDALFYLHAGSVDEWQDFGDAVVSAASFPFANGGNTIAAGIDPGLVHFPPADSTILRFLNSNSTDSLVLAKEGSKTIKAGTTLTFVNETSNEPHTITVVPSATAALPNIPPDPAVNVSTVPGAVNVFDGTKMVNSGSIFGGHSFILKFTKPGVYHYGCLYHDNSRMEGWITVTT